MPDNDHIPHEIPEPQPTKARVGKAAKGNSHTEETQAHGAEGQAPEKSPTDVFKDLGALRQKSKLTVKRVPTLINVAVGRPPNNVYFRTNQDPKLSLDDATVLCDEKKTFYYVVPDMRTHSKLRPRLRKVTLRLAVTWPVNEVLLWPVAILEDRDFAVWRSARVASELAETRWTQMAWDDEKRDYIVEPAEGDLPEPRWPQQTLSELLMLAFSGRVIDSEERPYVRRLRGLAD